MPYTQLPIPSTTTVIIYIVATLIITTLLLKFLPFEKQLLGHDRGRKFAEGSSVNIGKPTGTGIYFVTVFCLMTFLIFQKTLMLSLILILIMLCMVFGFLDDRSKTPWGEYVKGALDFVIAIAGGYLVCESDAIIAVTGTVVPLNIVIYAILAVILFIVSINATNATDGVDGLSGTLTVITIIAATVVAKITGTLDPNNMIMGLLFIAVLLPYLFFNHYPSKLLMGDAGSRAIGFFIAYYLIALNIPFSYLVLGLPFMIDGGLSILKITIGRLTKKKIIILKNVTTPIHDHLKKRLGFSVPKTYFTIVSSAVVIDLIYICVVYFANK